MPSRRHAGRPPQPPPVPAAALPGGHRRPVAAPDIASPIRRILRRQAQRRACCSPRRSAVDVRARGCVLARRRARLRLPGARHRRHPLLLRPRRVGAVAPGPQDARGRLEIRRRVLLAFEARRARDRCREARRALPHLRGGRRRARPGWSWPAPSPRSPATRSPATSGRIDPRTARVVLVEAGARILPAFPEELSAARGRASSRRSACRCGRAAPVTGIDARRRRPRRRPRSPRARSSGRRGSRARRWAARSALPSIAPGA